MYCPRCKKQVNGEAKFCPSCGAPLQTDVERGRRLGRIVMAAIIGAVFLLLILGAIFWFSRHLRRDDGNSASSEIAEEKRDTDGSSEKREGEAAAGDGKSGSQSEDGTEEDVRETAALGESEAKPMTGWQLADNKWYYYDEQGNMLADAWIGNYYVGGDGAMLTHTLTPDGYWLGEDGLASEGRRIYGTCVFRPVSHRREGDKILMTGTIGDTGYASQEYIDSLKIGDWVMEPDGQEMGMVIKIETEEMRQGTEEYASYHGNAVSIENRKADWEEWYHLGYVLHSQYMIGYESGSMEGPVYRPIEENVLLIADKDTKFNRAYGYGSYYGPESMDGFIENAEMGYGWYGCLEIELTGDHIDQANDIVRNYVG